MSTVLDSSESTRNSTTVLLRVISLSIASYDYILTLPAEWRFYRSQRSWRLSPGCILFIAIRYSSIAVLLVSNVGYFGNFFTAESCQRYHFAAPVMKVIQAMVSQLILGIRTVNISRRSTWVTWTIVVSFIAVTAAEWFLNLWNRVPVQGRVGHTNCTAGNRPPLLTVWLFYVCAMIYDMITLAISTGFLISFGPNSGSMARLVKIMLTDGLVYFVALTGVNILNLILYRSTDEASQSSGVSLGYALTWIMSQRILIHLRVVSRQLPSAHSISQAMRSQFETKSRVHLSSAFDLDWSLPSPSHSYPHSQRRHRTQSSGVSGRSFSLSVPSSPSKKRGTGGSGQVAVHEAEFSGTTDATKLELDRDADIERYAGEEGEEDFELDVQVKIEETVTVEYDPEAFDFESYRTPRVKWEAAGNRSEQMASVGKGEGCSVDGDGVVGT